jgi:hypothetical protein
VSRLDPEWEAARRQGLVLLADHLLARGIAPDLENTGGMCMALLQYVLGDDGEEVVVASGEGDDHQTYYVARYPASVWNGAPGEVRDVTDFEPEAMQIQGVKAAVDRWLRLVHQED